MMSAGGMLILGVVVLAGNCGDYGFEQVIARVLENDFIAEWSNDQQMNGPLPEVNAELNSDVSIQ